MTAEELSKQFFEKQEELEETGKNLSVLNTNSNFIYGALMGFALSMLTLQVHANTAFSVLYLGFTIASIVCIVLEIH